MLDQLIQFKSCNGWYAWGHIEAVYQNGDATRVRFLSGLEIETGNTPEEVFALIEAAMDRQTERAVADSIRANDLLLEKAHVRNQELIEHGIERQIERHDEHYHGKQPPPIAKA